MKKLAFSLALCLILSLSACETSVSSSALEQEPPAQPGGSGAAAAEVEKTFGTFALPQGWFESEELSQENNYFYLKEGTSLEKPSSNISIEYGTNRYGKGEEVAFAQAIDRQLKSQVGPEVVNYTGSGSFTKQGLVLITITVETRDILTVQHYIVGEYKYVMVHMTDFHDEQIPDVQQAALDIVDSFVWSAGD